MFETNQGLVLAQGQAVECSPEHYALGQDGRAHCQGPWAADDAFAYSPAIEQARAEERRRIGRELHDSTSQLLVALQLRMGHLRAIREDPSLAPLIDDIEETLVELRREIRCIAILNDEMCGRTSDLPGQLAELARRFARVADIAVTVTAAPGLGHGAHDAAPDLYRIAQEALANILRHAGATEISIELDGNAHLLQMTISDNGVGLPAGQPCGSGLHNIAARAHAWGGHVSWSDRRPGTRLCVTIPHEAAAIAPRARSGCS